MDLKQSNVVILKAWNNYINKELGFVTTYYLAQLRWYFKYFMTFSKRDHFKASWSGSGQKISG
jgi:hypothetical protein